MLRKSINRETVEIPVDNYTHLNKNSLKVAQNAKKKMLSLMSWKQLKQDWKALIIQNIPTHEVVGSKSMER